MLRARSGFKSKEPSLMCISDTTTLTSTNMATNTSTGITIITKAITHIDTNEHGRTYAEISRLIAESSLSDWVKSKATGGVSSGLPLAEGKIHGLPAGAGPFSRGGRGGFHC